MSTYGAYPLLRNRWCPSQGHFLPANSIHIRQSVSESLRLSLLNSLVPWESSPAEYRAEGSNCQVQGVLAFKTTSTEIYDSARLSRGPARSCDSDRKRQRTAYAKKRSGPSNSVIFGEESLVRMLKGWGEGLHRVVPERCFTFGLQCDQSRASALTQASGTRSLHLVISRGDSSAGSSLA